MKISTKVISAAAGIASVSGLLVALAGIVLVVVSVANNIPTSKCLSNGWGITEEQQQEFSRGQIYVGIPFVMAGFFCLIGGVVGSWAGWTGNKTGLTITAYAEWFAFVFAFQGAYLAHKLAEGCGGFCNSFDCSDFCGARWEECLNPKVCCDCSGKVGEELAMCKPSKDWACSCADRKTAGIVIAICTMLFTLVPACLGCGATWCCQDNFYSYGVIGQDDVDDDNFPKGRVVGQATVMNDDLEDNDLGELGELEETTKVRVSD